MSGALVLLKTAEVGAVAGHGIRTIRQGLANGSGSELPQADDDFFSRGLKRWEDAGNQARRKSDD